MPHRVDWKAAAAVVAVAVAAFTGRLVYGMHVPLDADEATCALVATHIAHGHWYLMEANFHYLGALNSYIMAPFTMVVGSTLLAVRLATAVVGTAYTLVMYAIGCRICGSRRGGIVLSLVASFFPVFVFAWNTKARTYGEMLLLTSVCIWLALRIAWPERAPAAARDWALFGVTAGIGLWNDILMVVPLAIVLPAIVLRIQVIGTARVVRGAAAAGGAGIAGFAPWIAYNVMHPLRSLHGLPRAHVGIMHGISGFLRVELPMYGGAWGTRSHQVVNWIIADSVIALGVGAIVWTRRKPLCRLVACIARRNFGNVEPIDMILAVLPALVIVAVLGPTNAIIDEPRYLVPGATSMAVGLTILLFRPWPWRAIVLVATTGIAVVGIMVLSGPMTDTERATSMGARIPADLSPTITALNGLPDHPIIANYWLARPLMFESGERLAIAEYGGGVAFADVQNAAETSPDPSWLFVTDDPTGRDLVRLAAERHLTYRTTTLEGFVLYSDFSRPVRIADLNLTVVQ